jgi:hypothetical protein
VSRWALYDDYGEGSRDYGEKAVLLVTSSRDIAYSAGGPTGETWVVTGIRCDHGSVRSPPLVEVFAK